jgi:hypothetical protein
MQQNLRIPNLVRSTLAGVMADGILEIIRLSSRIVC